MVGSEPLIQEADPHIKKLAWSSDVGKDGPNKKNKKIIYDIWTFEACSNPLKN